MTKKQSKAKTSRAASVVMRNAVTGRFLQQKAAASRPQTGVKGNYVIGVATRVTGDAQAAERWYSRPNDLLGGRTPKQAVKEGDQDKVVGLLLNAAGQ